MLFVFVISTSSDEISGCFVKQPFFTVTQFHKWWIEFQLGVFVFLDHQLFGLFLFAECLNTAFINISGLGGETAEFRRHWER